MEKSTISPTNQLNFRNHCVFCLKLQPPGVLLEICRRNSKNIQDFQPILNYLTGTDPTYDKGNEECLRKGLPLLKNSPPMCQQCYEMMGELNNLHQLLLHVQVSIQRQTEMIRETITETCPNPFLPSQRKEFNDRILASGMPAEQNSEILKLIGDLHDAIIYENKMPVIYPSKPPPSMSSQQLIKATPTAPLPFTIPSAYSTAHANATTTTGADVTQRIVVLKQTPRNPKHSTKVIITAAAPPPPPSVSLQSYSFSGGRKRKATLETTQIEPAMMQTTSQPLPPSMSPNASGSDCFDDDDDDVKYDPAVEDVGVDQEEKPPLKYFGGGSNNSKKEVETSKKYIPEEENKKAEISPPTTKIVIVQTPSINTEKPAIIPRVSREEPSQKCDLCGQRCLLREIANHLKTHVTEQFITKCLNPKCGFHFSCPLNMEMHIRKGYGKSVCSKLMKKKLPLSHWKMKCQVCNYETGHRIAFKNHLRSHEDEIKQKKFSCPIPGCSRMFSLLQSVEYHIYFHDLRPPPFEQNCPICKKVVKVDKIRSHLKTTHKILEPVSCKHCNFLFPDRRALLEHILEQKNEEGWTCDICEDGMKYVVRNELRKHYFHVHQIGELKSFVCEHCSLEFGTVFSFNAHMNRKHPDKIELKGGSCKKNQTKKKTYSCDLCPSSSSSGGGVVFTNKGSLRAHKIMEHGAEPFACKLCNKTFMKPGTFRKHQKEHTGIVTSYKCSVEGCGKVFDKRYVYHNHQLYAHGSVEEERPFKCETCGKGFRGNYALLFHQRSVHLGIRPYVCETCGEAFKDSNVLVNHKLIHTGERPHKCPICDQRFRQKVVLRTHLKGHEKKGENFKPNGPMKNIRKRVKKS